MSFLALAMNLKNLAPTQYMEFDFNSLCEFNGQVLGANEDGIFLLESGDLDVAATIDAYVEWVTDFGISSRKHVRRLTIAGETQGDLLVTVQADGGDIGEYSITGASELQQGIWHVYLPVDCRGRYFTVRISNVSGSQFSTDEVFADVIPINMLRAG